ncbi:NAD-dependent epimerase/dehydratase family protein [Consotaella salsifontis]|uniref:Nucleoside-diphosphate-sugar epimerase n=1 Tax=Consotaella salsifontis TaxID=1365950 RepID=A0A1T4T1A0_9HYPH|nr:NAD(P)-dependent oxidoreductase [Consotaella salsifontis]SKA34256.1 Nucleoside-diphosphate-sugar epimerase [Consotaella salsifontis]
MSKILVTGHQGFVGTRLARELLRHGHLVGGLETPLGEPIDLVDADAVDACVMALTPQVVIHLGGVSGPMLLNDRPDLVLRINGEGTQNVLSAAARHGVQRVIYASSVAAFAVPSGGDRAPETVYGVTKRLGEMLTRLAGRTAGLETCSVRIGSVFGAGRETANPMHEMVEAALDRGVVPYGGATLEPCIEVRDCAAMLAGLATAASLRPSYDAVLYTPTEREVAGLIAEITGAAVEWTGKGAPTQMFSRSFDAQSLIADAGVGEVIPLRDALADLVRFFQTKRDARKWPAGARQETA